MRSKILIVDDAPNVLRMIGYALELEGFEVVTAVSGEEALDKIASEAPDLVVLDRMLPGMDGTEVCQEIRNRHEIADLPIIMLSARAQVEDRISGLKAGADEYVTKPFDTDEMVARVSGLLERRADLLRRQASVSTHPHGKIVTLCGPKGGVGRTVIAANLAIALGAVTQKRVLLVDADLHAPDVGTLLDLYPKYTLHDLLRNADQIDDDLIATVVTPHSSGIEVLVSAECEEVNEVLEAPALSQILHALRERFDYIVVDPVTTPGKIFSTCMEHADVALLVVNPEVTSTYRAKSMLKNLQLGQESPIPLVVLNREDRRGGATESDVQKGLAHEIASTIPEDSAVVTFSVNEGVPFMMRRKKSEVSKRISKLAETIVTELTEADGVAVGEASSGRNH